jgi:hypothetical protein
VVKSPAHQAHETTDSRIVNPASTTDILLMPPLALSFPDWTLFEWVEFLSYLVTVVGLPFAILVFLLEARRERQNDEEEIFQRLSDQYTDFLKLVLENADLHLLRRDSHDLPLTPEQGERKLALFGILVSIFERAYMLVYEEDMNRQTRRLWQSWEDYIREWCGRTDFREALPQLLQGEDPDFRDYITRIALCQDGDGRGG